MPFPRTAFALLLLILTGSAASAARPRPAAYKGAIVMDAASGRVLFADHADEMSPPASMTKLMTFAVLEDRIRQGAMTLRTPVPITPADARVAALRDSTNVALRAGETFPVEELIYAMMLPSANDAAYAVAAAVGGTVPNFVAMMNAKARALGMTRTIFRTPNGLPVPSHRIADGDLTTPRDFALLCRYLIVNTNVLHYTSVRERAFAPGIRFPTLMMVNHNHLLGRIAGVDGLKTGFTNGAGFCLSATARRGNRRVIVVMMGCPDSRSRDLRVAELIDRGFELMPAFTPVATGPNPAVARRPAAPAPRGSSPIEFIPPQ